MQFMVTARLEVPSSRQDELPALVEAEGEYISEQFRLGNLEALYIVYTGGAPAIWAVVNADSLAAAQRQIATYPLSPFMRLTYMPLSEFL